MSAYRVSDEHHAEALRRCSREIDAVISTYLPDMLPGDRDTEAFARFAARLRRWAGKPADAGEPADAAAAFTPNADEADDRHPIDNARDALRQAAQLAPDDGYSGWRATLHRMANALPEAEWLGA